MGKTVKFAKFIEAVTGETVYINPYLVSSIKGSTVYFSSGKDSLDLDLGYEGIKIGLEEAANG